MTNDDNFDWGVLGKDWWMEAMETTKATLTQTKFACARHAGATRTKSAELSGYSASDAQGLRTAGSRADDTEPFGKAIWDWCVQDMGEGMRDLLYGRLANADWQLEARQKIWAEIGIKLGSNGQFNVGTNAA